MQKVISQVELNFWNWYIVLLSQSPALRVMVQAFYRLTRKQLVLFYLAAAAVIALGFGTGMILFALVGR